MTLYICHIYTGLATAFNFVLYCILCICVHYLSCWMLVVWMLYVNKIYIIFTNNVLLCFFYIIKIIYCAAINAILIASVLYTVCHLWQPVLFTLMAPLLADWAIWQNGGRRPAAGDLNNVSLVVVIVIVLFVNCCNNYSRFRYSYMYIMMFITYICIFSYKLPSHIHTWHGWCKQYCVGRFNYMNNHE